jgi:hypothetical protein
MYFIEIFVFVYYDECVAFVSFGYYELVLFYFVFNVLQYIPLLV